MKQKDTTNVRSLLPVSKLMRDSWELFKTTWVAYVKLIGLLLTFVFGGMVVGFIIAIPLILSVVSSHFQVLYQLTPFYVISLAFVILWIVLYVFLLIVASLVFQIASILILQKRNVDSVVALSKKSQPFLWSFFLTMLLSGIVIFGGTMVFIVPGLIIMFLFAFVSYEIVLENQSGVSALKRSYFMIKNYFWEVLGRLVILEVAVIIISAVFGRIAGEDPLLRLVQFLFSFLVSWYARSYVFLLYQQIKERTTFPKQISFTWVWIVSGIGWLLILLAITLLVNGVFQLPHTQPLKVNVVT